MSRAYKIRVKESLSRVLRAEDSVSTCVELLEVLPAETMRELLARELEGRGFRREGQTLTREDGEVTTTVDAGTGEVTVKAGAAKSVKLDGTREGLAYDDFGPGERRVRDGLTEQVKQDLERRAEHEEKRLQSEATSRLEGHLADLRKELDQAVNRVTAEALKQKAAQLGRIQEIQEDVEAGSLSITLEV